MSSRILAIDDSKTIRMIIRRALREHDCVFFEAANGEEGLAVAARERPELIILDITMPVMDGITMLARLRGDADLKATPVIMLTAESGHDNVETVSNLGISDYLVKPFKDDQLIAKISKILAIRAKVAA
jgi:CheY-like chemotaxis protein